MAGNRKPRKKYNRDRRAIFKPMMATTHAEEAVKLHAIISGLCAAPSNALFNEATKKLAGMTSALSYLRGEPLSATRDAPSLAMQTAILTLDAIAKRYERSGGKLYVSPEEAFSLKRSAVELDRAMATIPANLLEAARIATEQLVKEQECDTPP